MLIIKYGLKKIINQKQFLKLNIITLSISWYFSVFLIYQQAFKALLIKILIKSLIFIIIIYLDNILIYIKIFYQIHIKAIKFDLQVLRKYNL